MNAYAGTSSSAHSLSVFASGLPRFRKTAFAPVAAIQSASGSRVRLTLIARILKCGSRTNG